MFSRRLVLILLLVAVASGFAAGGLAAPLAVRFNWFNAAALLAKLAKPGDITTKVEERTVVVPKADYFADALDQASQTVAAIQSFQAGRLIRSGSGLLLTRDGLAVTVNSVVPPEAELIQVALAGKLYQGRVMARNYTDNSALLILGAGENDFSVGRLELDQPTLAQNLLVYARLVTVGRDNPWLATALVAQLRPEEKSFAVSTGYNTRLYGAALLDDSGGVLGILDFKNGQANVLSAAAISRDLNSYLGHR